MDTAKLQKSIEPVVEAAEDAAHRAGASAAELRQVVAERAHELSDAAREAAMDARSRIVEEEDEESSNTLLVVLLVLALAGLVAYLLKRKREQELDEALWEEPRAL